MTVAEYHTNAAAIEAAPTCEQKLALANQLNLVLLGLLIEKEREPRTQNVDAQAINRL